MDNLSIPVCVLFACMCAQLLNVEEAALWVYRDVLPIPIWFRFLLRWPTGVYLPGIVRGCYLTIKLTGLLDKVHVVRSAVEALVLQQTPFGRHASADEVRLVADNMCTICHDSPSTPIRLQVMDECRRMSALAAPSLSPSLTRRCFGAAVRAHILRRVCV